MLFHFPGLYSFGVEWKNNSRFVSNIKSETEEQQTATDCASVFTPH